MNKLQTKKIEYCEKYSHGKACFYGSRSACGALCKKIPLENTKKIEKMPDWFKNKIVGGLYILEFKKNGLLVKRNSITEFKEFFTIEDLAQPTHKEKWVPNITKEQALEILKSYPHHSDIKKYAYFMTYDLEGKQWYAGYETGKGCIWYYWEKCFFKDVESRNLLPKKIIHYDHLCLIGRVSS